MLFTTVNLSLWKLPMHVMIARLFSTLCRACVYDRTYDAVTVTRHIALEFT